MKKIKITWFRIYFNYQRNNNLRKLPDSLTINTSKANVGFLKKEINKLLKDWSGRGYIEITAIEAGPFLDAENWAKNNSDKFVGKIIKFNN